MLLVSCAIFSISLFLADAPFEFTFIHTTDVHGWVNGDPYSQNRDADIADLQNLIIHLKEKETSHHKVFAFDSGDHTQGTGLSDVANPPGSFLFDLFQNVSYDALTLGNHELYTKSTIDYLISIMDGFGDRYLASNVQYTCAENKSLGRPYKTMHIPGFGNILVIPLLFDFHQAHSCITVTPFPDMHTNNQTPSFLRTPLADADLRLVVLLAHLPPTHDPETDTVLSLLHEDIVRSHGSDLPVIMLGGHDHNVFFEQTSPLEIRLENKCFMKTVTVLTFTMPSAATVQEDRTVEPFSNVTRSLVQSSKAALREYANCTEAEWDTPTAPVFRTAIAKKIEELRLTEPIALIPHTYENNILAPLESNLFHLITNIIYPLANPLPAADAEGGVPKRPIFYAINAGSLRSPLHEGEITYDTIISVDPFQNVFAAIRHVSGKDLITLVNGDVDVATASARTNTQALTTEREKKERENNEREKNELMRHAGDTNYAALLSNIRSTPPAEFAAMINTIYSYPEAYYNNSIDLDPEGEYDIVSNNYDVKVLSIALNRNPLRSRDYEMELSEKMTIDTFISYLRTHMPLPTPTPTPEPPPPIS